MPRGDLKGASHYVRKTAKKPRELEAAEQYAVVEWANLAPCPILPGKVGDYLFAIPNGGYHLRPNLAKKMKRMGIKSGVSDLFLAIPAGGYHGLFVEMKKQRKDYDTPKRADKAPSESQLAWLSLMLDTGYFGSVAYGANEAIEIIEGYLET